MCLQVCICVVVHERVCAHECGGPRLTAGTFIMLHSTWVRGRVFADPGVHRCDRPSYAASLLFVQLMPSYRRFLQHRIPSSPTLSFLHLRKFCHRLSSHWRQKLQSHNFFLSFPFQNLISQQASLSHCQNAYVLSRQLLFYHRHLIPWCHTADLPSFHGWLPAICSPHRSQENLFKAQATVALCLNVSVASSFQKDKCLIGLIIERATLL